MSKLPYSAFLRKDPKRCNFAAIGESSESRRYIGMQSVRRNNPIITISTEIVTSTFNTAAPQYPWVKGCFWCNVMNTRIKVWNFDNNSLDKEEGLTIVDQIAFTNNTFLFSTWKRTWYQPAICRGGCGVMAYHSTQISPPRFLFALKLSTSWGLNDRSVNIHSRMVNNNFGKHYTPRSAYLKIRDRSLMK